MATAVPANPAFVLHSASGLNFEVLSHGAVRQIDFDAIVVNLFVGNELDGAPANLWLRRHGESGIDTLPLLGPGSLSRLLSANGSLHATGEAFGLRWHAALVLARDAPAWFWHVQVENPTPDTHTVDLVWAQDIALTTHGAVRLNEHYVSHYVDFPPLTHPARGRASVGSVRVAATRRFVRDGRAAVLRLACAVGPPAARGAIGPPGQTPPA
jgi:1,2-beta-oligoglucan phosphorylase